MLLDINQIVDILLLEIESVDGEILSNIDLSFGTTLDPFFSSPNKVRAIAGSYISDVPDQILLYLINAYSIEAMNTAVCNTELWSKWEYYASLWVAYKTALNAILNSKSYVEDSGQKIYKKLGDFSISKDSTSGETPTSGLINKLECELLKLSVAVKWCKEPLIDCVKGVASNDLRNSSAAQLVIKGGNVPRPMFGRTFRNSGRHPQLTRIVKEYDRYVLTNSTNIRGDEELDGYELLK
jgi:hypothetical protein